MNDYSKYFKYGLLSASILLVTACGSDNDDDYIITTPVTEFAVDEQVKALVDKHDIFKYDMKGVQGETVSANALVFTPKGAIPIGGWPVVVWAHGTTGGADQCAPSRLKLEAEEKELVMDLVERGYAVIAPDYEGLGNDDEPHPYLHLNSAATSILTALSEAKKHYSGQLSKEWSVVGWSQGGHAALGAAEFHTALEDFEYKGAVTIAPASYLADTLQMGMFAANMMANGGDLEGAVTVSATLHAYAAIVSSGIKAEKTDFKYTQAFIADKASIAEQAETLCSPQVAGAFGQDIQQDLMANGGNFDQYQALQPNFLDDEDIKAYLDVNTPAQKALDKPVYIFQGTADTTVPFMITQQLVEDMEELGTDVTLIPKPEETHATSFGNNIKEIGDVVDELMSK